MKINVKDFISILFGIILVAISIEYFLAPNNIAGGGITGLAIIINAIIPKISISLITLIINGLLFVVAFMALGGDFGKKSIITTIGLSIVMWLIEKFLKPQAITNDLMIATIFGTIISALGMAIVFYSNSSTGGTDILAKVLNQFFNINIGTSLLIIDFIITLFAIVVFGVNSGLYALLSVMILGVTIDKFIDGFNVSKELIIMSSKYEIISKYIINDLKRGCTYLQGEGVYSGKKIKIIYSVVGRNEFIKLKKFIKNEDSKAFISVRESYEILGEGFTPIEWHNKGA